MLKKLVSTFCFLILLIMVFPVWADDSDLTPEPGLPDSNDQAMQQAQPPDPSAGRQPLDNQEAEQMSPQEAELINGAQQQFEEEQAILQPDLANNTDFKTKQTLENQLALDQQRLTEDLKNHDEESAADDRQRIKEDKKLLQEDRKNLHEEYREPLRTETSPPSAQPFQHPVSLENQKQQNLQQYQQTSNNVGQRNW